MRRYPVVGCGLCLLVLAGCAGGGPSGEAPALATLRAGEADLKSRQQALGRVYDETASNPEALAATRQTLKDLVWTPSQPGPLRVAAMKKLLTDTDEATRKEARDLGRLLLPREQSREMVILLGQTAADNGWVDYVPSLIRAYARPARFGVKEEERAERTALERLKPGVPVQELAMDVFLHPPQVPPSYGLDWSQRARNDAWELLGRLDPDGAFRLRALDGDAIQSSDPTIAALAKSRRDLRALPLTADQMSWLLALANPDHTLHVAWWTQARNAISRVPQEHLDLRHAEAIRWTSQARPDRLSASREALLEELRVKLAGRSHTKRSTTNDGKPGSESLKDHADRLTWADLVTILAIDDLLASGQLTSTLLRQADMDRSDTTTEYGGMITCQIRGEQAFGTAGTPVLYPPRPGQRMGDERFVASDDMMNASHCAIAHYHFHAQKTKNKDYAGPSAGDLDYAKRYGRSCLVLTYVGEGVFNVDYYQPNGVVLDLGELRAGDR